VYVLSQCGKPFFVGQSASLKRRATAYTHSAWLSASGPGVQLSAVSPKAVPPRHLEALAGLVENSATLDLANFWRLVADAGKYGPGLMAGGLRAMLSRAGPEVAAGFASVWEGLMSALYSWPAWDVGYVLREGCSDDGFECFRAWVITLGPDAVENFLADPLAWAMSLPTGPFRQDSDEDDAERVSYAPFEAYESLTGERLKRHWPSRDTVPSGERTPEEQIMSRYADLAARRRLA
jgi:Protein of unknown function (DUF4240)